MARRVLREEHLAPEPPTGGWIAWVAGRLGVPPWGQLLIVVLVAFFGSIGMALWSGHDRLSKIEASIRVLASQRPQEQRELIRDLLSQAQREAQSGSALQAALTTQLAAFQLSSATRERTPAPDPYFKEVSAVIDALETTKASPELEHAAFRARVSLAEYRSALAVPPTLASQKKVFHRPLLVPPPERLDPSSLSGPVVTAELPPGTDLVQPRFVRRLANNISFGNLTFVGITQTLDGFHWHDITFVNSLIKYDGGEVDLKNVRFINCTFEFLPGPRAVEVAKLVALDLGSLKIG